VLQKIKIKPMNENMSAIQIYFFNFCFLADRAFGSLGGGLFEGLDFSEKKLAGAASSTTAQESEICLIAFSARLACDLEVSDRLRKSAEVNQVGDGGLPSC
jgi:hypothetical protein